MCIYSVNKKLLKYPDLYKSSTWTGQVSPLTSHYDSYVLLIPVSKSLPDSTEGFDGVHPMELPVLPNGKYGRHAVTDRDL